MTLLETLVVLALLTMLIAFLAPAFTHARQHSGPAFNCGNNLRLIGTAFTEWAADNLDDYPMAVSTNVGGSREYATGTDVFPHFLPMSNEFGQSPKTLLCPKDRERLPATNFDSLADANISYFLGVTVSNAENTNLFLCGDRNISDGIGANNSQLALTTNDAATWTRGLHTDERRVAGMILQADGSVSMMGNAELRQALKREGVAPAILALP
jgi:hypothetical protein